MLDRFFGRVADRVTTLSGHPITSLIATALVLCWLIGGFFVGFTDSTYEFVANTTTTLVTFVMVFVIQHSTNRSSAALQLKVDVLTKMMTESLERDTSLEEKVIGSESLSERHIKRLKEEAQRGVRTATSEGVPASDAED